MARAGYALGRLGFTALAVFAFLEILHRPGGGYDPLWVTGMQKVWFWVVPALAVAFWLAAGRTGPAMRALGLRPFAARGVWLGFACTVPFGLAWWVLGHRVAGADELAGDVLLGPLAEEVLFRGFLFLGLRKLGWRFWSAGLVSALAFGVAHVPSLTFLVERFAEAAGLGLARGDVTVFWRALMVWDLMWVNALEVTLQIAAGGLLFAWVCDRWQSLWPAIGLHMAINFWWIMTFGAEGALDAPLWPLSPWTMASTLSISAVLVATWLQTRRPAPAAVASQRGPSQVAFDP